MPMAMTESLANHQQYLHESVALAGPSSAPSPAVIDDSRKPSSSSSQASAAAKASGPTPPSSPSRHAPIDQQPSGQSSLTNIASDQADRSSSPGVTSSSIQQQPTPPSTLPENAAFPQAASENTMDIDTAIRVVEIDGDTSMREGHRAYSVGPVVETHVAEAEDRESSNQDGRPVSPQSALSSPSLPTLDDDAPTLSANEAAYVLEADAMDRDRAEQETRNNGAITDPLLNPPAVSDSRVASRLPGVPRVPSNSSQQALRSNLPSLQGSLQIPQQPQTHLYQPGGPYPYLLPSQPARSERDSRVPLSPEVPPWQPDSEVNNCPICRTGFSFFYRKHHCRKCGRVVCAPCSPHRIVIPKSFVVYPPNTLEAELLAQTYVDGAGNRRHSYMGGDTGVEVRICNNCLAGENSASATRTAASTTNQPPIQSPAGGAGRFWQTSPGGNVTAFVPAQTVNLVVNPNTPRRRTVSSANPLTQAHGHHSGVGFPGVVYHHQQYGQAHSLGRNPQAHGFFPGQQHPPYHSHPAHPAHPAQQTHQPPLQHPSPSYPHGHQTFFTPAQFYPSPQPQLSQYHHHHHHHHHPGHQRSVSSSSPYNQYSPVNQPIRGLLDTSQQPVPAFSMPDTSRPHLAITNQFAQGSSREQLTHSAPPQPQPRLKETDYCPICTAVLPPPNPVTKDESAREAHIQQCIENAVSGNDVPQRRSASASQTLAATMTAQPRSAPTFEGTSAVVPAPAFVAATSSSSTTPYERVRRHTASARTSGGRMVVYTAVEKDTFALGNDAEAEGQKAECVICFEEFEVGDSIARLECFCRYHKDPTKRKIVEKEEQEKRTRSRAAVSAAT
ncbi:hypothetical protein Dda_0587 [Drechslerella dactyloides]|uniref:FYVE-type domain-containing protein n=1 Tax=Drechslerella dactyloides TaxID=74499 RepID=A0AAD6J5H7_DREDA|nr:hypothetical protein Dda_0587 [Drechslerella dactyloides]